MNAKDPTITKILILDAGKAAYPLSSIRSLGTAGYKVYMGFSYGSRVFNAYSRFCEGYMFHPDPLYASDDFIEFLKKIGGKYELIIPITEEAQLATSRIKKSLEEKGSIVPIPDYEILVKVVDKVAVLKTAIKADIPTPKTLITTQPIDIAEVIDELGLPFIMKVSTEIGIPPGPGNRYFVIKRKIDGRAFISMFAKLRKHGPVILQEYITGTSIGVSVIISRDRKLIAYFGHRRILEQYPDGGPSVIAETYLHPKALKLAIKLLKALNWYVVAMTEFKVNDDSVYFIELNPRFWGTLPLAIASGVDFPRLIAKYYLHQTKHPAIDLAHTVHKKRIFIRLSEYILLLIDALRRRCIERYKSILGALLVIIKQGGMPFVKELEKLDIAPLIVEVMCRLRCFLQKNRVSNINNIIFGPVIQYDKLAKMGVKTVIDLRETQEKHDDVKPPGNISYYAFPIKDNSAPDVASFKALVHLVNTALKKGKVYLHLSLIHI